MRPHVAITPPEQATLFAPPATYQRDLAPITEADAAEMDFTPRPPRLATVVCCVCGATARIPILADGKLCDLCRTDLEIAESNIEADLERAHIRVGEAQIELENAQARLDADLAHADDDARARYQRAVMARETGAPQAMQRWQKTIDDGVNGAALLQAYDARLRAYDARLAAARALTEALGWGRVAMGEIEAARHA